MDALRARTTLFCGALALAIALSMLLRGRKPVYFLFGAFAGDIALWWASQSLSSIFPTPAWMRLTAVLSVLIPQFAVHLFQAILPPPREGKGPGILATSVTIVGLPLIVLELSPYYKHPIAVGLVYSYVFGFLVAALASLARRGRANPSKAVRDRMRFLVAVGALSIVFTMADFLSFLGVKLPPIGAVLSIVFLFVLSESLVRARLADLYEMAGRLLVATALAFALATLFYVFESYMGQYTTMYNAILAAIVFIVLSDPLRSEVEKRIHQFFFRERYDFETSIADVKRQLAHALELSEIVEIVLAGLERSRRVTTCAVYLQDQDGDGYDVAGAHGQTPTKKRLESLAIRPLLDRLAVETAFSLEEIARDPKKSDEPVLAAAQATLGELRQAVVFGVRGDQDSLVALVFVVDDRVRDAFTPDEVTLLSEAATQMGIAIANSRIYSRMKERDRLAALGAMAAGLAHEIKNPLGAIKGAAQLLEEGGSHDAPEPEFVGIILEEVDRLNRVVGSFLDYARPHRGNPIPIDVNSAIRRTVQILSSQMDRDDLEIKLELADDIASARIDPEQFRQVLMNLIQNGIHAMAGRGALTVSSATRRPGRRSSATLNNPSSERAVRAAEEPLFVEVSVRDTGPGIAQQVLKNLFVPFFTTKEQGTGLGLAISQSIVQNVGGRIEVQTQSGAGTTFTIVLPASPPGSMRPIPL